MYNLVVADNHPSKQTRLILWGLRTHASPQAPAIGAASYEHVKTNHLQSKPDAKGRPIGNGLDLQSEPYLLSIDDVPTGTRTSNPT